MKEYNITYNIILFIIFFFIFYIIDNLLKNKEHMNMYNTKLKQILIENNYEINTDNFTINKCNNNECIKYKYDSINFNNSLSHHLAKNKPKSNKIFQINNIPVPKHWIINNNNKEYYIKKFNIFFPCVLKPVDGMQGKDVNTFIKNKSQYISILESLLKKYKEVMLENQVYGDNYRIFLFHDKVIDIIKREQPFIIGNDINTIEDLIKNKNNMLLSKKLFPTTNIDYDYILEQGYSKINILEKNKKIFITNTINFHNGANPIRIDINKVPIENIDLFIKAHKLIELKCSGIDYMSNDIYIPYNINNGHIIEINDMVDTKIHMDADNGNNPNYLFNNILKIL